MPQKYEITREDACSKNVQRERWMEGGGEVVVKYLVRGGGGAEREREKEGGGGCWRDQAGLCLQKMNVFWNILITSRLLRTFCEGIDI